MAKERGIAHADHLSQLLTAELLEHAEAIFVFDRGNVARLKAFGGADMSRVFWLGDFDPVWTGKRAIIDPWSRPREEFARTFERIERCMDEVASALDP